MTQAPETCQSPDTSSNISGTEEAQAVNVDRQFMGTPEAAKAALLERAREWREYRQPSIATANEHRRVDTLEREARFQLANAALLWLWHEENPLSTPTLPQDVAALVERLETRAADYRQSGPSAEHSAALYDEAAAYIRSQSSIIASQAEKLERTERNRDMWKGQVDRQASTIASAREVIEPFAAEAEQWGKDVSDDAHPTVLEIGHLDGRYYGSPAAYTIGHLRAARDWKGR